ncbi:mCG1039132 [Mus musculus]|nr:mCG1039132 [Mus musculus]
MRTRIEGAMETSKKLCSFMRSHLSVLDLTAQAIAVKKIF